MAPVRCIKLGQIDLFVHFLKVLCLQTKFPCNPEISLMSPLLLFIGFSPPAMKVFGFEIRVIWEKINDQRAQKKKSVCYHTFPSPLGIGEFRGRGQNQTPKALYEMTNLKKIGNLLT